MAGCLGPMWVVVASICAGQSSPDHYRDVPLIVGEIEPIRVLLHDSLEHPRRLLILGDSQETSPGGFGRSYVPHLQQLLSDFSGGIDRTPIRGNTSSGSGTPPAGWLSATSAAIGMPDAWGIAPRFVPPGVVPVSLTAEHLQPGDYGPRFTLVHDGAGSSDPLFEFSEAFIDPDRVVAEILAITNGTATVEVDVLQRPINTLTGWSPVVATERIRLEPSGLLPGVLHGFSEVLDRGWMRYNQVEIRPVEGEGPVVLLGVRYRQLDRRGGLGASVHGKGGNSIRGLLADHGESAWFFELDRPDVVVVQLGANDVRSRSVVEFESDVRALVEWLRDSAGAPCLPVVLMSDPWQELDPALADRQDRYPGVLAIVAEDTPGVVALNQRLALETTHGWGPDDRSFLLDTVHLTDEAQALAAESAYALLMGTGIHAVPADLNADGCVNGADFGLFFGAWSSEPSPCIRLGDLDRDGSVDGRDLGLLMEAWGTCPGRRPR